MKKFLVWIDRKPTFTGNSIPEHRSFIQNLRDENHLLSAGGFTDQTGGAYVLQANSLDEAVQLMNNDPMYLENECVYRIKEWNA